MVSAAGFVARFGDAVQDGIVMAASRRLARDGVAIGRLVAFPAGADDCKCEAAARASPVRNQRSIR
jgi:hypothetical protein